MISLHDGRGSRPRRRAPRGRVVTLRLTIASIQPAVWRRLVVRESMWLNRLHEVIQAVFTWYDYQTHIFTVRNRRLGNPLNRDGVVVEDDRDVTLAELHLGENGRLAYDYLLGEGWHVDLRVEKISAPGKRTGCPRCTAGERAGPPEDCGGIEAYKDMVYCLRHPQTDLGREWREWVGPDYDPETCDLAAINRVLRRMPR